MTSERVSDEQPIGTTLWCVNIYGPDDVLAVASRKEAVDLAARFNAFAVDRFERDPHPYSPLMWAVPTQWPHDDASHASNLGDLGEYAWLRSAREAEPVNDDDNAAKWRENVEAMLSSGDPDVIRCHEGGGPESLIGSLVLTMMRTRNARDKALHPSPSTEGLGVRVKGLEWSGDEAETPFGKYQVERTEDGYALTFGYEELAHIGFNAVGPFESARDDAVSRAHPHYEHCILSALSTSAEEVTATHRHKKRGTEYVLIGIGKMQAEDWLQPATSFLPECPVDMREVAIYRSATDPKEIWVRPREEFEDGRFEALSPSPKKEG